MMSNRLPEIPEELAQRIRAHEVSAGPMLRSLVDWAADAARLHDEYNNAIAGCGDITDEQFDALGEPSGDNGIQTVISLLSAIVERLQARPGAFTALGADLEIQRLCERWLEQRPYENMAQHSLRELAWHDQ